MYVGRSIVVAAVLICANQAARAADAPLMVLEPQGIDKPASVEIKAKPGVYFYPPPLVAAARWRIAPGDDAGGASPPPERLVEFLRKGGDSIEPFCLVQVRYFRHADRWRPAYRLDETPLFARDPTGRWRPLTMPGGDPALLQRLGSSLPNGEGFFPELEFSLSTGPVAIDSWVVR